MLWRLFFPLCVSLNASDGRNVSPPVRLDSGCRLSLCLCCLSLQVAAEPSLFSKLETNTVYVFGEWRRTYQLHYLAYCTVQLLGIRQGRLGVLGK